MPSVIRGDDDFDSLASKGIGEGQTYQNVSASRVAGENYTNNTGRTITLLLNQRSTSAETSIVIDGSTVAFTTRPSGAITTTTIPIPPDAVYSVSHFTGSDRWFELVN